MRGNLLVCLLVHSHHGVVFGLGHLTGFLLEKKERERERSASLGEGGGS